MNVLRPALLTLACMLASPVMSDDLPSLGDASSSIVSPEQEFQLGRAWLSMLRNQVDAISDPQLKDFVESSVYRLAETSDLQDHRLAFILIRDAQINAFAAPGGVIGVNGGLLLNAQTEGEYAAVLAHELGHLIQRHFARGIEAQQRMQLPVMAAMLAGIVAAAAGAGDAGIAAIAGTQAAAIQNQLRFSRQNEQEADRVGVTNMVRAGYDPRSMPNMFERLARQYRYDGKPPEFLLTHPVTESRIADTRNRAEQYPQGGKEDSLRYQQMRARTQLLFEETPGMAGKRFRAMLNDNPKLDAARYGLAISQTRIGQLNDARDNLRQLLAKAPNDVAYNLAQVELDITANRLPDADQRLKKMLAQFPSSYPLKQVRADLMLKMSKPQESEKILDDLSKARPLDGCLEPPGRGAQPDQQRHRRAPGPGRVPVSDRRLPGRHRAARFRQAPRWRQLPTGCATRRPPAGNSPAGKDGQGNVPLSGISEEKRPTMLVETGVGRTTAPRLLTLRSGTPSPGSGVPGLAQARGLGEVEHALERTDRPRDQRRVDEDFPAALAQAGQGPLERVHRHPRAVRATAAGGAVAGGGGLDEILFRAQLLHLVEDAAIGGDDEGLVRQGLRGLDQLAGRAHGIGQRDHAFRRFGVDQDGGVRVERLHVFQLLGLELLVDDAGAVPEQHVGPVSRWM